MKHPQHISRPDQLATPNSTVTDNDGAAARIGVSPATLATWRCTGEVRIPFIRVGKRIVYRIADLDAFLDANTVASGVGGTP